MTSTDTRTELSNDEVTLSYWRKVLHTRQDTPYTSNIAAMHEALLLVLFETPAEANHPGSTDTHTLRGHRYAHLLAPLLTATPADADQFRQAVADAEHNVSHARAAIHTQMIDPAT